MGKTQGLNQKYLDIIQGYNLIILAETQTLLNCILDKMKPTAFFCLLLQPDISQQLIFCVLLIRERS